MAVVGPKATLAAVFIGPFIVACMLGIGLVYLYQVQVKIFYVDDTIRVTGKPATVSYTTSTPVTPCATTLDGTTYTLIRPTSSYTRVYLGKSRGFDYSTFGPKTLHYITSSKPHLNSGRPYTFKSFARYMRPTPTWRFGM